eukprot:733085-Pleurochrysis_carterae.AAC.1
MCLTPYSDTPVPVVSLSPRPYRRRGDRNGRRGDRSGHRGQHAPANELPPPFAHRPVTSSHLSPASPSRKNIFFARGIPAGADKPTAADIE